MTRNELITKGYEIAARDLRACYNPDGIVAGRTHFNAYWARDGFWGVFGSLELRDFDQVRNHLEFFAKAQLPSGELPAKIEYLDHPIGHYHTRRMEPKRIFRIGQSLFKPVDPAALFVIAIWQYYRHTLDRKFLQEFAPVAERAVRWLERHDRDNDLLLETGSLSDWMDSVLKSGKILNINVLYAKSVANIASIFEEMNNRRKAAEYRKLANELYERIRLVFWNGEFFVDWIKGGKAGGFVADGNVLAILFGIASEDQTATIFSYISKHRLNFSHPLVTVWPAYRLTQILPNYTLFGMADYHSALIWPWIGSLHSLNKFRHGHKELALDELATIASWYVKHEAVYEIYNRQGNPVDRRFYQAEQPFAWNAACFIYAAKSMGLVGEHEVLKK